MTTLTIRKANRADLNDITRLLSSAKLPKEGIARHLQNFLVAEVDGKIVGTIGLEKYNAVGLLRSASVLPSFQNNGIGTKLFNMMMDYAKEEGINDVILLTTTAERYFEKKGFMRIDRKSVSGEVLRSEEFNGGCPSTAICMRKII